MASRDKAKSAYEQLNDLSGGHDVVVKVWLSTLCFLIDEPFRTTEEDKQRLIDAIKEQIK